MDALIIFFGQYFGYILVGLLALFLLRKRYMGLVLEMIVAAILSRGIITETIRFLWQRSRPFVEQNFVPLIPHADTASFPSGHATFFFAIGTVLYVHDKKAGMAFLVGSALVVIARVFAGLHWPSDIIGGALIGVACGLAASKFAILYSRRFHAN